MRVTLMDGGMGQELIARTSHPLHPLWSSHVMMLEPEIVRDVHAEFIRAGARLITTNAYTVTGPRLRREGLEHQFDVLQKAACTLAVQARDAVGEAVTIAGSLPPLVGSYRPDIALPFDEALGEYRRIVAAQAPYVDVFLAETMPSAGEARAAAVAAAESGLPVWVSWTLADDQSGHLRSGETIDQARAALDGIAVDVCMANCSQPESVSAGLPHLLAGGGAVGAYANGFVTVAPLQPGGTVAALEGRRDMGPDVYAKIATEWVELGVSHIGGCCEISPAHIAAVADALRVAGHEIVGG